MDKEKMFSQIQARLSRNYEKQMMYLAASDRAKPTPLDGHWLKKQFELMRLIRKNFQECEILIQTGALPYSFIISEAGREVERKLYTGGEWDGEKDYAGSGLARVSTKTAQTYRGH